MSIANPAPAKGAEPIAKLASASDVSPQPAAAPPVAVQKPTPTDEKIKPEVIVAGPARLQLRHRVIATSFVLTVILPVVLAAAYLWGVARDQYHSSVSFSVQAENSRAASSLLSGLSQLAGNSSSASDQEILFQYIQSQDLIEELNRRIDLRDVYSRNWPADPVFAFNPAGSIEDLHRFWLRNVDIGQDGNGLMTVFVRAPAAEDAQRLTESVFNLASELINRIAAATRNDLLRYAREELAAAETRLTAARLELTDFRLRMQIVDPTVDLQGQMGILNGLQTRLVETMIELDRLSVVAAANDPRRSQILQSKASIEGLIEIERRKFGKGGQGPGGEDFATIFSEYERLSTNLHFADSSYQVALANHDSVQSTAARQSRYLAAHIRPTLAERSLYPERLKLAALLSGFVILLWSLGVLVYYSVRDRR